jgi:hypothetical protein
MQENMARIIQAYKRMALDAKYRPMAPGDGFGNVFLDREQLSNRDLLYEEAEDYMERFIEEEDTHSFHIGVSNCSTVRAFVYTIEAARCLCAGSDFDKLSEKLLKMAVEALKPATRGAK